MRQRTDEDKHKTRATQGPPLDAGRERRSSRATLRVVAVPADYVAGYPRQLDAAELRALLERRLPPRVARFAATAAVAFGLQSCGPQEMKVTGTATRAVAPADLEDRVRACLDDLASEEHGDGWRSYTTLWRAGMDERMAGSARFMASVPIRYGNSFNGIFDPQLARRFAREVFSAYGLSPIEARVDQSGVKAVLDGFDPTHGIGFELRDVHKDSDELSWGSNQYGVTDIDPADALDDREVEALRRDGVLIHVSEPEPVYDGDVGTAITTWMLGLIEFLNEVTDGPDFDLGLVLAQTSRHIDVDPVIVEGQAQIMQRGLYERVSVVSTTACRIALPVNEVALRTSTPEYRLRPISGSSPPDTFGDASPTPVIFVPLPRTGEAVLIQTIDGEELRIPPEQPNYGPFRLPPRFDPERPFRIEFQVPPGVASIPTRILIHRER